MHNLITIPNIMSTHFNSLKIYISNKNKIRLKIKYARVINYDCDCKIFISFNKILQESLKELYTLQNA